MPRARFHREADGVRRAALIDATAKCLARVGAGGISVRKVAAEAGVSAGLLTHYFTGIDDLVVATYRDIGARVTAVLDAAVAAAGPGPRDRLRAFVDANFRSPISDPALIATWAAFWGLVARKPDIAAIHAALYAATRAQLEALIGACDSTCDVRLAAIGLTALIDGLWLERSLDPAVFSADEAAAIAADWLTSSIG